MRQAAPALADLLSAMDATWTPAAMRAEAGWTLREGKGGGKRVSAASRTAPGARVEAAEAAMRAMDQRPIFMLRPGEEDLDAALAARGYAVVDPVTLYAAPPSRLLAGGGAGFRGIVGEYLMPVMEEIWSAGGIGPARLAVMDRVAVPKAYLLSRTDDTPGGVAFAAAAGPVAMIHAIEVLPALRRRGLGRLLVLTAAAWAAEQGAEVLALAVTDANAGANALYAGMGMEPSGRYHYRQSPD